MWVKEKFYKEILIKRLNFIFLIFFFIFFFTTFSYADLQKQLIIKYKSIDTLHFDFSQKIGDKVEFGNCYIKYPLLMKCEYPKKKKSIISNGKKFAIVKKRYKKIYFYPLKKTPLFYLLDKEYILNVIQNYKPINIDSRLIQYELFDDKKNRINVFFNKNSLELSGWKTIDAYSNEVNFLLRNIKTNISIKNEIFKIPKEEDL
tara:strand:+ start:6487 stop:7095 length:609 start_codon:yes stop_codon:yes gene_type:complete